MKKISLWLTTLAWAYLIFYLTTIPDFHPSPNSLFSWILSNGGHFFFFGVLAVLLSLSLPTIFWRLTSNISSILATSLYGLTIEFIQRSIPGRSFSVFDWLLDTLGAIIFLAIIKKYENFSHGRSWLYRGNHR